MAPSQKVYARNVLLLAFATIVGSGTSYCQSKEVALADLSKKADVIAVGRVSRMKAEWTQDRSRIQTTVTVSIDEYVKGSGGSTLELSVPGGEVGSVGEVYSHMPKFLEGENVVVFAEKDKRGHYRVAGGSDGKYGVKKDEVTGKPVVAGRKPLDDFKTEIRNAAKSSDK